MSHPGRVPQAPGGASPRMKAPPGARPSRPPAGQRPALPGPPLRAAVVFRPAVWLIPSLLGGLALAGCALLQLAPAPSTALTLADSGREVGLAVGAELEVSLDANPTTGFDWTVVQAWDEAVLELRANDYQSTSLAVGSGGSRRWRFAGKSAGQTALSLAYRRSWETGVPPLRTFTLTVSVGAPGSRP